MQVVKHKTMAMPALNAADIAIILMYVKLITKIINSDYYLICMGRNKYSDSEIQGIAKLLRLKNCANRAKQKEIRHKLRVEYEFNISDFNVPGRAFGEQELYDAIHRGAIRILDDQTIADMKAKRARDRERDEAARMQDAVAAGEQTDWQEAMKQWQEWEASEISKIDK